MSTATTAPPAQLTAPLSALAVDASNIRKTGRGAEPAFVASIRKHGIIIPLIVRANGNGFKVTKGGKRHDSLLWMQEHQEIANGVPVSADYQVPIVVVDANDTEAKEISLITSVIRRPAHPVDEFEAYAELAAEPSNMNPDDIAKTFGIARKQVDQAMALGALSPKVRKAWRDGGINAEAAQAFTLARSHKDQDKVLAKLEKQGRFRYGNAQHEVRGEIIGSQGDLSKVLAFVGVDTYKAAGGTVIEDLFNDRHGVSDPALLKKLSDEKIAAKCDELVKDGWSFAKPQADVPNYWQYQQIDKKPKFEGHEAARIKELHASIKKISEAGEEDADQDAYEAMQQEVEQIEATAKGRAITAKDKAASGCFIELDGNGLTITYGVVAPQDAKGSRAAAGEPVQGGKPEPAKPKAPATLSQALKTRLRTQMLISTKKALLADKLLGRLAPVLAKIVAAQINTNGTWNQVPTEVERSLVAIRDAITPKVMNEAARAAFDAKDYFSSVPKSFNLKAITEAVNADEARKVAGKKGAEIAKFALANVGKKWLPPELRAAGYDGPGSKKAKK